MEEGVVYCIVESDACLVVMGGPFVAGLSAGLLLLGLYRQL